MVFVSAPHLNFTVTKNDALAAEEGGGEDPDCMKVIHMYYSSLPLPFILRAGWSCIQWKSQCTHCMRGYCVFSLTTGRTDVGDFPVLFYIP